MAKILEFEICDPKAVLGGAAEAKPGTSWMRGRGLFTIWRTLTSVRRERRAVQELHALDDRMLRDIGIDRGQIHRAARHGRERF